MLKSRAKDMWKSRAKDMWKSRFSLPIFAAAGCVASVIAVAVELSSEQWTHVGNWTHDFTTGPGVAGIAAVVAASIAYTGIKQQVDKTAEANRNVATANIETARKNKESQWWDTLKWTYTEAMATDIVKSGFRGVAAVKILESLNTDHDKLTVQQRGAVESILDMFSESNDPEVKEAARPLYASFGRTSPLDFEKAVGDMLRGLNLRGARVSEVVGDVDSGVDYIVRSQEARVAVMVKLGDSKSSLRRARAMMLAILLRHQSGAKPFTAGLLITSQGIPVSERDRSEKSDEPLVIAGWQPGGSTHEVEGALSLLLQLKR